MCVNAYTHISLSLLLVRRTSTCVLSPSLSACSMLLCVLCVQARASFVHTGQAGAALKGYYDRMLASLSLASGGGYRLVLPSFFHLLHHLVTQV